MDDTSRTEQFTVRVTVGLTTYRGHRVEWEVVGTSPSGDFHEAMMNIAPGFAPQPLIAEHLWLRAGEFVARLEDSTRWSTGGLLKMTGELWAPFAAGDYQCVLRGGGDLGWVLSWTQEDSPTEAFIGVHPRLRNDGIPTGLEDMAEVLTLSSDPITVGGRGGTIRGNEPWTLRAVDWNTEHS
jgi:hypothetical protein